jgi:hypothetical protein
MRKSLQPFRTVEDCGLDRVVKKQTGPVRASHPSRSHSRCDLSGRHRFRGAGTPPAHCDARPATAAPPRVRAYRTFMHAAHAQRKQFRAVFAQGTRLLEGAGVEVNMGVVTLDTLHDGLRIQCAANPRPQLTAGPVRSGIARCWPARSPANRQNARPAGPGVCAGAAPRNSRSARSRCR